MTSRRGFTLIELMVVVAIIGLLVSITMPAFAEARRVSKKSVCLNNLHQIGVAMHEYLQANRDTFPYMARFPTSEANIASGSGRNPYPPLPMALGKETGGRSPTGQNLKQYMEDLAKTGKRGTNDLFLCPADSVTKTESKPPVRVGARYYDTQTTSYEWENLLDGLKLQYKTLSIFQNYIKGKLKDMWMIFDFEAYHGGSERRGTHNVLYADFHVQSDQWVKNKAVGEKLQP